MRTCAAIFFLGTAGLLLPPLTSAGDGPRSEKPLFERIDIDLAGRLRHLTLEDVLPGKGMEVVIAERRGEYPNWGLRLGVWEIRGGEAGKVLEVDLPPDALFYRFLRIPSEERASLLLVMPGKIVVWKGIAGDGTHRTLSLPLDSSFPPGRGGDARPLEPLVGSAPSGQVRFWVPTAAGVMEAGLGEEGLTALRFLDAPPRTLYAAPEGLPLLEPFWLSRTLWYPKAHAGKLTGEEGRELLFFPWMDEVTVVSPDGGAAPGRILLNRLSGEERDDEEVRAVTWPADLNGDGRTDFLVNRYEGTAARMKAEITIHMTDAGGTASLSGDRLAAKGDGAAFAVPVNVNGDRTVDLAVASSQFNMGAILRALVRKQFRISFSIYLCDGDGCRLEKPDFSRRISFRLRLSDLRLEGLFPKLEGDFNGDGYRDILYAQDSKELAVLIQNPGGPALFPETASGVFKVPVLRGSRIADLDGDGRSDIVLYDSARSGRNRATVLLSTGAFR